MRLSLAAVALPALLALAPPPAEAATYTSFWAFGDSLTDPGNLFAATGGQVPPSPPYGGGRFSNGPVWAEGVAVDFAARGLATGNFAFGFARAVTAGAEPGLPGDVPDLPDQVALFDAASDGLLGDRPVAALWFGANDLFAAIASGDPSAAAAAAAEAAGAVLEGIEALAMLDVRDFVVFNLPALERIPAFTLGAPEAAPLAVFGTDAFNAGLAVGVAGISGSGLGVAIVDLEGAFATLLDSPGSFGLSDPVFPCYVPGSPPPQECAGKVFFDAVHPTAAVHAVIADLAREEVAPVPLPLPPALGAMGLSVLGLFAIGRRRAA